MPPEDRQLLQSLAQGPHWDRQGHRVGTAGIVGGTVVVPVTVTDRGAVGPGIGQDTNVTPQGDDHGGVGGGSPATLPISGQVHGHFTDR